MNKIDISEVFSNFKTHFEIEGNSKIVFSAKYGTGKSYFLNAFFKEEYIKKNYNQFTISPVNYVVSSNEDVFDLIKVDIIKQLYLFGQINFNEIAKKTSSFEIIKQYIKKNPLQIVKNVSSCFSKISGAAEALNGISESVIKLITDFEEFEKKITKEKMPTGTKLLKYAETFSETKNSYLEYNFITQLIFAQLESIKNKSKTKNVLVIEDFDRLDPAHIFRILNIFSAHQSEDGINNKFGFDKILLICDLDNIETIYKHFYGENTDFKGYIDKFYSLEPYYFDNKKAISIHLKDVLRLNLSDAGLNTITEILIIFIKNNVINLRKVLQTKLIPKQISKDYELFEFTDEEFGRIYRGGARFISSKKIFFNHDNLELLLILRVLKCLFGSYDKLGKILHSNSFLIYNIDPEISCDIAKTFALPAILNNHYRNILFNDYDHNNFNYPDVSVLNHRIRIMYKWKNSQPFYTGEECFFNEVNIVPLGSPGNISISSDSVLNNLSNYLKSYSTKSYLYS